MTADIAIVGAGFAGLSAARRLLQIDPGLRVALLEAGQVAEGPAGRNSGFMIDLPHDLSSDSYTGQTVAADLTQTRLNRCAIGFAADAAREYQLESGAFDPCGKINAAATEKGDQHNRDYAAHLDTLGEPHEWLDAQAMEELTGTRYYSTGLFTPGTAMLQPAAYIQGLAQGLRGAIGLYENSAVLAMTQQGTEWLLESENGSVSAQKVVLATNGHAESFGFFKRRLVHVFTYASMTGPLPAGSLGGRPGWGVTPADPMGTTVRRIPSPQGERVVVRSRFTYNPSMAVSDAAVARAGQIHDRKFAERFPTLKGLAMQYRWAGHLCLTWNGVAAHGEIQPGLFSACCQNGLGTAKGTLAGISAADLALGQPGDISRELLAQDPPKRLPPEPLAWIGANATLRWKEWRAGRE